MEGSAPGSKNPVDFFNGGSHSASTGSSAQEQYYQYKLLKAKIKDTASGKTEEEKRQKANELMEALHSEEDKLKVKTLSVIGKLPESSPEFAQLAGYFGTTDKYALANALAGDLYRRQTVETIMSTYSPDKADVLTSVIQAETNAQQVRARRVKYLNKQSKKEGSNIGGSNDGGVAKGYAATLFDTLTRATA